MWTGADFNYKTCVCISSVSPLNEYFDCSFSNIGCHAPHELANWLLFCSNPAALDLCMSIHNVLTAKVDFDFLKGIMLLMAVMQKNEGKVHSVLDYWELIEHVDTYTAYAVVCGHRSNLIMKFNNPMELLGDFAFLLHRCTFGKRHKLTSFSVARYLDEYIPYFLK